MREGGREGGTMSVRMAYSQIEYGRVFSAIFQLSNGLGLGFRVRVLVVVRVWVRVTVGARVMVGVGLVRG